MIFVFPIFGKMRIFAFGKMAEWSNAAVLKTVDLHGSGGSNPSLSASNLDCPVFKMKIGFFCGELSEVESQRPKVVALWSVVLN